MMGVGRADLGGRHQGVVSTSGWEHSKTTDLGVLTSSESIQQMRVREEKQALYMAIGADQGARRWCGWEELIKVSSAHKGGRRQSGWEMSGQDE